MGGSEMLLGSFASGHLRLACVWSRYDVDVDVRQALGHWLDLADDGGIQLWGACLAQLFDRPAQTPFAPEPFEGWLPDDVSGAPQRFLQSFCVPQTDAVFPVALVFDVDNDRVYVFRPRLWGRRQRPLVYCEAAPGPETVPTFAGDLNDHVCVLSVADADVPDAQSAYEDIDDAFEAPEHLAWEDVLLSREDPERLTTDVDARVRCIQAGDADGLRRLLLDGSRDRAALLEPIDGMDLVDWTLEENKPQCLDVLREVFGTHPTHLGPNAVLRVAATGDVELTRSTLQWFTSAWLQASDFSSCHDSTTAVRTLARAGFVADEAQQSSFASSPRLTALVPPSPDEHTALRLGVFGPLAPLLHRHGLRVCDHTDGRLAFHAGADTVCITLDDDVYVRATKKTIPELKRLGSTPFKHANGRVWDAYWLMPKEAWCTDVADRFIELGRAAALASQLA